MAIDARVGPRTVRAGPGLTSTADITTSNVCQGYKEAVSKSVRRPVSVLLIVACSLVVGAHWLHDLQFGAMRRRSGTPMTAGHVTTPEQHLLS